MRDDLIAYAPDEKPIWVVAILHGHRSPRVMAAIFEGPRGIASARDFSMLSRGMKADSLFGFLLKPGLWLRRQSQQMTRRSLLQIAPAAAAIASPPQAQQQQQQPQYRFGTTVVSTTGLQGRIHLLKQNANRLPARMERMKPAGTIYTTSLNVWPQRFDDGFPGVTDRFEWFAIDYTGRFWI